MTNKPWMQLRERKSVWAALLAAIVLFAASCAPGTCQTMLPYQNPKLSPQQRAADLVSRMTLEEKVSQTMNDAPAIPRLGIPAYNWWSEGLHGIARSGYATVFPQAIGNAATWDAPLVHQMGTVISTEARAKYNQAIREGIHSIYFGLTIWSPNINIFRDPRWGRGQETYGEDPFLTGQMGVAFVTGLQGDNPHYLKTVATSKHFAVHSGPEPLRHEFNVDPSPYDLEDTYLPAFRATVVQGHADSLMCSYNAVDGVPACANTMLLQQTLRRDWGFMGYVTSDCGAIDDFFSPQGHHYSPDAAHASASAMMAGTDTNCGDSYKALVTAVKEKLIPVSALNTAVERLFTARFRLGMFDPASMNPYAGIPMSEVDSPAHRALALEMARESMVLLKNENGFLPFEPDIHTIAVVGPNAASLPAIEGNYHAIPSHPVLPLDGMRAEFGNNRILYAQGSSYAAELPVPIPETAFHPSKGSNLAGLTGMYFASSAMTGKPAVTRIDHQIDFDWDAAKPVPGAPMKDFGVRWTGTIEVPAPGDYPIRIDLTDCYPCNDAESYKVFLDGKEVAHFSSNSAQESRPRGTRDFTLHFDDTKPHRFRMDYTHHSPLFGAGITLGWMPPADVEREQAVAVAKKADAVVAFVGLSPNLEGEEMPIHVEGFDGGDRTKIQLPTVQQQLLKALGATGKPLVVVLLNGSALAVNWAAQHANAILEAWYPGEVGGTAIAETLDGKNNPAGRLPVTFYRSIDQIPPFTDYSMKGRTYRYFHGDPLYPFGYGLSYTKFAFSGLKLSTGSVKAGDDLGVDAEVRNTGQRAGDEVVEVYLTPPQTPLAPIHELEGFTRIHLLPGEAQQVHFTLRPRQLSMVDAQGNRSVQPGEYQVFVGGSQPAPGAGISETFTITGSEPLPR
ncbi:MAG TPA: glycoside hydrolase family 3 C-terminal domain-containing protein [Acidobacteriaceae bacterium]|nr:glycoside hydrolase family 3 C-terminal domain-containing protein [Acidobacteriaceae bacterium]